MIKGKWIKEKTIYQCSHPQVNSVWLIGGTSPFKDSPLRVIVRLIMCDGILIKEFSKDYSETAINECFDEAEKYIDEQDKLYKTNGNTSY